MFKTNPYPWIGAVLFLYSFLLGGCKPQIKVNADPPLLDPTSPPVQSSPTPKSVTPTSTPKISLTLTPEKTVEITPNPSPYACPSQEGQISSGQITTTLLLKPLEFRIYLPPCYDQEKDRRYPVLYLIHGQGDLDDQWERLGAGTEADKLITSKSVPPFIIIMPFDRVWTQPTEDMFGQALVTTLIPWVDQNYRTLPDRNFRAIGGLSRGAGWAVHIGLTSWNLFGSIGAHSLAVFYTDSMELPQWLDAIPRNSLPRIFLDVGDKDLPEITDPAIDFENLLTDDHIPHEWYLFTGHHDEKYWKAHVETYLRWYAKVW